MNNEYFGYLVSLIQKKNMNDVRVRIVKNLNNTPFIAHSSDDENRIVEALYERKRYSYDNPVTSDFMAEPVSLFEIMVVLAGKCEAKTTEPMSSHFWYMVESMLGEYSDKLFDDDILKAANKVVNREYDASGRGGLFYVPNCKEDMSKLDLWVQLCRYVTYLMLY